MEIIPFIDIMFFLLATFMMVSLSMIKNEGLPVNLPAAVTSRAEERQSSVTVTLTEDDNLYLEKEMLALDALKTKLRELKTLDADLKVFINGDRNASFGQAIEVLDELRSAGIQKVSIQTKSKQ